jgi:hypothetical protein
MNDAIHSPDIAYLGNAGLVLLHPFLPVLFKRLNLVTGGDDGQPQLRGENAARAVQLLQYLVDGRSDAPAPQLLLNKLLCGLEPGSPVPPVELGEEERGLCDQLLVAVISQWSALGKTSPEGLRKTFLQREGRLQEDDAACTLAVVRRPFDVLLSRLPWSLAVIRQPWMPAPLHVSWP